MKQLIYLSFFLYFFSYFSVLGQEKESLSVQVLVIDEDRIPIEKARVLINGNRLISDVHGIAKVTLENTANKIQFVDAFKKGFRVKTWNYNTEAKEILVEMESENHFIKGELLVEHNIPFVGAKIHFKNYSSLKATQTNELGFFRIAVPDGSTLENILANPELIVNNFEISRGNIYVDEARKYLTIRTTKSDINKKVEKVILIVNKEKQAISNLKIKIAGQNKTTNEYGEIQLKATTIQEKDVFIDGYTIESMKSSKNTITLLVHKKNNDEELIEDAIEQDNDTLKKEFVEVKYQINDASSYSQDFEIVFNQLESRKQILLEKSLVLRREMNKIAAKIEKKGNDLDSEEKNDLEEYLSKLENALIDNELSYQKTQAKTHDIITHIQKDLLKVEEEKEFVELEFHIFIIIALLLLAAFIGAWVVVRRIQKQNIELEETKNELVERINEINAQNEQMESLNVLISSKNKKITDSIRYAKTIQEAILPNPLRIHEAFNDYFIIYKAKDIVSGDFYWFYHTEGKTFVAAIDCTGHGVSGGFMSMIGNTLLNEIVNQQKIFEPAQILETLNKQIRIALKQDEKSNDDGMDICLCLIEKQDENSSKLTFTGAKRPLYYLRQESGVIETIKGDTKSVGGKEYKKRSFTDKEILLTKGDMIYLTSDGLVDQNNESNLKFGTTRLKEMLRQNANLSMLEQKNILEQALEQHQQGVEQRDDITIVGVKI